MDLFRNPATRAVALGNGTRERANQLKTLWQNLDTGEDSRAAFARDPEAVKSLQRQLVFLGYTAGAGSSSAATIDGLLGSGTQRAIQNFQQEHHLPVGSFDGTTAQALGEAVAARATHLGSSSFKQQLAILDGRLDRHTHLGVDYRAQLEAVAGGDGPQHIPADWFYALMQQESSGGKHSLPRWEASFARSLGAVHRQLNAQRPQLEHFDPGNDKQAIDELFARANAQAVSLPGLLASMTGPRPTTEAKLQAMRSFADFTPGQLRELATTYGYGQIAGYQTLDYRWQQRSGKSGSELLTAIQSPDPRTQLQVLADFIRHGEDARGLHGGLLAAMRSGDPEKVAAAHNGGNWRTYNPEYAENLLRYTKLYQRLSLDSLSALPVLLDLAAGDPLALARQRAYARNRSSIKEASPAAQLPEAPQVQAAPAL